MARLFLITAFAFAVLVVSASAGHFNVTLVGPADGGWNNTAGNINFTFIPAVFGDAPWNITNCSFFANFSGAMALVVANASNLGVNGSINGFFNVTAVPEGENVWNITCSNSNASGVDGTAPIFTNSSIVNYTFNFDRTNPIATLTTPGNTSTNGSWEMNFTYTLTERAPSNCSLFLNESAAAEVMAFNASNRTALAAGSNFIQANVTRNRNNTAWTIQCLDKAGNIANSSNGGNFTVSIADVTSPSVNIALSKPNVTYLTAGQHVNISVIITDDGSGISAGNISVRHLGTQMSYPCNLSTLAAPLSPLQNRTYNFTCDFATNLTEGGNFSVIAVPFNDSAGNAADTFGMTSFLVYNARPKLLVNGTNKLDLSKVNTTNALLESFAQKRANYSLPMPFFMGGGRLATAGSRVMPMYFSEPPFAMNSSSVQENLVYNYTLQLNISNLTSNTYENFSIKLSIPGLRLAQERTETIFTPQGMRNMTMFIPNMTQTPGQQPTFNNVFDIWLNGTKYSNTGELNMTHRANGTYDTAIMNGSETVTIWINATNYSNMSSLQTITLLFVSGPTIQVEDQRLSGFNMTSPPVMGQNQTASFYINVSSVDMFYSSDNVSVAFMFPANATTTLANGSVLTFNLATNITIYSLAAGGAAWAPVGAGVGGLLTNYTTCVNMTENITNASDCGAQHQVCMVEYRVQISNTTSLSWRLGQSLALMANASFYFPAPKKTVPGGGTGSNTFKANVQMASEGGLVINTSDIPGFEGSTSTTVSNRHVFVDGRELTYGTEYTLGSLVIGGASLSAGTHVVLATYDVAPITSDSHYNPALTGGASTGGEAAPTIVNVGSVEADATATVQITSAASAVSEVAIVAAEPIASMKVSVQTFAEAPAAVTVAYSGGSVYKYVEVTTTAPAASIKEAELKFSVEKSWLTAQGGTADQIRLNRFADGKWNELPTTKVSEDADKIYFKATTPGFSVFAVTLVTAAAPAEQPGAAPGAEAPGAAPGAAAPGAAPGAAAPGAAPGAAAPGAAPTGGEVTTTAAAADYTWLVIVAVVVLVVIGLAYYMKMAKPNA